MQKFLVLYGGNRLSIKKGKINFTESYDSMHHSNIETIGNAIFVSSIIANMSIDT